MKVLNQASFVSRALKDVDLAARLAQHLEELRSQCSNDAGVFAFDRAAISRPFRDLVNVARALALFDFGEIDHPDRAKAFWLNAYNALTVQAVIDSRVSKSVRDARGFYDQYAYVIGGHSFTLDDIEHGVLRGNEPKYGALTPLWKPADPRLSLVLSPVDARIHFGLFAATRSSPPLTVFGGSETDAALTLATRNVLRQQVSLDWGRNRLTLPKLFKWYERDFGSRESLLRFIAEHFADVRVSERLNAATPPKISYADYDWGLNGPNITGPMPLL